MILIQRSFQDLTLTKGWKTKGLLMKPHGTNSLYVLIHTRLFVFFKAQLAKNLSSYQLDNLRNKARPKHTKPDSRFFLKSICLQCVWKDLSVSGRTSGSSELSGGCWHNLSDSVESVLYHTGQDVDLGFLPPSTFTVLSDRAERKRDHF